jgi:hypothetical protein
VAQIIHFEERLFFLGVVGFGGDGHLFFVVHFDGGKGGGGLHGRRRVIARHGRQRQPQEGDRNCPHGPHRARLYHLRVRLPLEKIRHA